MTSGLAIVDALRTLTRPADASSERILDAALACFTDGEIAGVTMNKIAERAGLGVATVYRRFARKEQLVQAVLLREARRAIDNIDAAVTSQAGIIDQITEGFLAFVAELRRRSVLREAVRTDSDSLRMMTTGAAPLLELGRSYLASLIRQWQHNGVAIDIDADLVADIYARLAHSIALAPDGPIPISDETAMRAFARTYLTRLIDSGGS